MTHDCRLGWHHAAQLIADSMPASFNPNAPRLVRVPLPENARALDVDPAKAGKPAAAPAAVLGDGWIAWGGGECPIPLAKRGEYEVRWYRATVETKAWTDRLDADRLGGWEQFISAYRPLPKEPA